MWKHMARIICEVQPLYVFVENSPILTSRGLGRVLGNLAEMGFDARWGVLGAADIGAPHQRDRIWIVGKQKMADTWGKRCNTRNKRKLETNQAIGSTRTISIKSSLERYNRNNWSSEPDICRMVNGIPDTVDRLKALGNAQVPLCAATAWRLLSESL
jgi:DNA (cytosine-5)-methyltransferase 1